MKKARMTPDEIVAVVEAYKAGRTIQWSWRDGCGGDGWSITKNPMWDFWSTLYRVEPFPRVRFFIERENGKIRSDSFALRANAEQSSRKSERVVCFVEDIS